MEFGCNKCGRTLSEEDFREGRGEVVDGLAWCAECLASHTRKPEPSRRSKARSRTRRGLAGRGGARAMRAREAVKTRFGSPPRTEGAASTESGAGGAEGEEEAAPAGPDEPPGAGDEDEVEEAELVHERRPIRSRRRRRRSRWRIRLALLVVLLAAVAVAAHVHYPEKVASLIERVRSLVGASPEEPVSPPGDEADEDEAPEDEAPEAEAPAPGP